MSGGDAVLVVEGVTKTYQMGDVQVQALRGVDLSLRAGELLVLLGPSGSGKSTLLNIVGGLDVPTSGRVIHGDHELTGAHDKSLTAYRRDHVGFVFQFYNLVPALTARDNVALVTDLAAAPIAPEEALALVGMGDRLDYFPAQLSGGEQQRVAIARVARELGSTTALITHNAAIAGLADRVVQLADGRVTADRQNTRRMRPEEIV